MISFVIPAHNEAALIARTIRSIHAAARQLGAAYEVVVADDASNDGTGEIAAGEGARVIRVDHRQIAATRNSGAGVAGGRLLVFVDADTIVTPGAAEATLRAFERGAAYGGAEVRWDGRIPLWSRPLLRLVLAVYSFTGGASGAYLFVRRDAFEAVGGFDEALFAGEEADICMRLRRVGRHAWVRSPVVTSGRKLRAYSAGELMGALGGLATRGRRGVMSRDGLDLWYAPRRPDPSHTPDADSA